jgi:DNA polymerase III epsilon subunit-like protein
MPRWIVGDTETTGTGPGAQVCEIAFAELDDDMNVVDRQYSLIDPQCPITPGAGGIHGIRSEDVADAPTLTQFFEHCYPQKRLRGDVVLIDNHKLSTLAYHFNWDAGESHRADSDVETCIQLLRQARKDYNASLSGLMVESSIPLWVGTMPFGKHKGQPIQNVPKSYIEWWFGQTGDKDADLVWTLDRVLHGLGPL